MRAAWPRRLLLAAAAALWLLGWVYYARLDGQQVHLVLNQAIDARQAQQLLESEAQREEPAGFCFWGQSRNQQVSCPQTGRDAPVRLVCLAGNPELLDGGSLAWQTGCLVDRQTALALFGTEDCGGQVAEQAGESYPVLGVIPTLEPTLVRLARPEDGPVLDRCVLVGDTGAEALLRWNLSGQTLDFRLLLDMLWNLALVLPVVYLTVLCWHLMKPWRQLTWPVDRALVVRLLLGLACLAGLVGLMSLVRIPPQMIPTQWSDFEFWGRWWAAEQENLRRIFTTPLGNRQLQMLLDMVKSMGSWGVSLLAGLLALAFRKRREKKEEAPCASC